MASITMAASFLGAATVSKQSSTPAFRGVVMAKATRGMETSNNTNEETSSKRRDLMFAAAAAAACSIAKIALAEEEPKRGSSEAKKKYAPICVTMPTAKICYK